LTCVFDLGHIHKTGRSKPNKKYDWMYERTDGWTDKGKSIYPPHIYS